MSGSSFYRVLFGVVLLIVTLNGSAGISAEGIDVAKGERLQGDRLNEAFSDAFLSRQRGSITISLKFSAGGEMSGDAEGNMADDGKWWIEDDLLCREWDGDFKVPAPKDCFIVFLDGDSMTWYGRDGSLRRKFEYMR
jgi:hypothetical protein